MRDGWPMNDVFGIDTNILVYAISKGVEKHGLAKDLVNSILEGKYNAVICVQNLNEFIATVTDSRRMTAPLNVLVSINEIDKFMHGGIKIFYPKLKTWDIYKKILKNKPKTKGQIIYDYFLAATLMSNGVNTLITENVKDFEGIKGFRAVGLTDTIR